MVPNKHKLINLIKQPEKELHVLAGDFGPQIRLFKG